MAFISTVKRSKAWSRIRGFVGSRAFNQQSRRYYYLPPPPHLITEDPPHLITRRYDTLGLHPAIVAKIRVIPLCSDHHQRALNSVRFALDFINRSPDRHSEFVRLVRASKSVGPALIRGSREYPYDPFMLYYYLTFEATDFKGHLTVYYAEVLEYDGVLRDCTWTAVVDHSFRYPFAHILPGKVWPCERESTENHDDVLTRLIKFEDDDNSTNPLCVDSLASSDVGNIYHVVDLEEAQHYAFSAVQMYNEKKNRTISLIGNVLCASKTEVEGLVFYFILLEAINEENVSILILATVQVSKYCIQENLIEWKSTEKKPPLNFMNRQLEESDFEEEFDANLLAQGHILAPNPFFPPFNFGFKLPKEIADVAEFKPNRNDHLVESTFAKTGIEWSRENLIRTRDKREEFLAYRSWMQPEINPVDLLVLHPSHSAEAFVS